MGGTACHQNQNMMPGGALADGCGWNCQQKVGGTTV